MKQNIRKYAAEYNWSERILNKYLSKTTTICKKVLYIISYKITKTKYPK